MNYKKYNKKDGSQYGWKQGGRGRNKTSECRHPELKRYKEKELKTITKLKRILK